MGGAINSLAFPAPKFPKAFYEDQLLSRQDLVWLTTSQNEKIPACYVRSPKRNLRNSFLNAPRMTLLYSHGNAEDLALHLDYIEALARDTDSDVFSYEYVGYSLSRFDGEGTSPTEQGCIRSIDAAWKYCVEDLKIPPKRIVIYGRSIGSGPSVDLASRSTVEGTEASPLAAGGVLLQSPLESGVRAVMGQTPSTVFYWLDIFKNYEKIDKITTRVAIMHGTEDEVVSCENGRNLHKASRNPYEPLWIEGVGHNDMPQDQCFRYSKQFLDALLQSASGWSSSS